LLRRTTRVLYGRHDERGQAAAQRRVHVRAAQHDQVGLWAEVWFVCGRRAEGVRVRGQPSQASVLVDRVDLVEHRVDRAAADAAAHPGDDKSRVGEFASAVGLGLRVQGVDADVRRDRVEAARVHDARAGQAGQVVVVVCAGPGKEHLARKVDIIGTGRRTGVGEGAAVLGVPTVLITTCVAAASFLNAADPDAGVRYRPCPARKVARMSPIQMNLLPDTRRMLVHRPATAQVQGRAPSVVAAVTWIQPAPQPGDRALAGSCRRVRLKSCRRMAIAEMACADHDGEQEL
jgi:hypothetical protein